MHRRLRAASLCLVLLAAPAAFARLTYSDEVLLYVNGQPKRQADLATAFDQVLRGDRPVVLFIHGRGDEPEKSINGEGGFRELFGIAEGHAVRKIESYGVTAVMFNWESVKCGRNDCRPIERIPRAAERFAPVLDALIDALRRNPSHRPVTFLVHSMGNLVLQRYVENRGGWPAERGAPLFANVILSSSDADERGHPQWVDRIAAVERVFITANGRDIVLNRARDQRASDVFPLGLGPRGARASGATYVELRARGHELFGDADFRTFFQPALRGQAPPIPTRR